MTVMVTTGAASYGQLLAGSMEPSNSIVFEPFNRVMQGEHCSSILALGLATIPLSFTSSLLSEVRSEINDSTQGENE